MKMTQLTRRFVSRRRRCQCRWHCHLLVSQLITVLLMSGIMGMMLLVVEQDSRTCNLTVGNIRSKTDTLQWNLVYWCDLLRLKFIALNCWRAVGCRCTTVVWIELQAGRLNIAICWVCVALRIAKSNYFKVPRGWKKASIYLLEIKRVQWCYRRGRDRRCSSILWYLLNKLILPCLFCRCSGSSCLPCWIESHWSLEKKRKKVFIIKNIEKCGLK